MNELARTVNEYWTLFAGVSTIFLFFGGLFVKIQSAVSASNKLFRKTDALERFQAAQEIENQNNKNRMDELRDTIIRHEEKAVSRHEEITRRLDKLFNKANE